MADNNMNESRIEIKESIFEWVDTAVISIIIVVILFTFLFRVVGIKGPSMQDTLYEGQRVIITNLFYTPAAEDIVVVSRNYNNDTTYDSGMYSEPIIKRVIALEGQTVDINFETGIVYVDGNALEEPYTKTPTTLEEGVEFPVRVPDNCVFVMGDNRNDSSDSRSEKIGMIDKRYILGKAIFRIYPFNVFGGLYQNE